MVMRAYDNRHLGTPQACGVFFRSLLAEDLPYKSSRLSAPARKVTTRTRHRALVGQGPSGPDWLATALRAGIPGFAHIPAEKYFERMPIKAAWGAPKKRVLRRKTPFLALKKVLR